MPNAETNTRAIAIFGDQLSRDIHALKVGDRYNDLIVMAEVMDEATYVRITKKLAFVFSAMRHFAQQLERDGWNVRYIKLDDPKNTGTIVGEIERTLSELELSTIVYTEASEYRLASKLKKWAKSSGIDHEVLPDDRFIISKNEFGEWADGRKQLRMEHFYREVRRKSNILIDNEKPVGGKWNFDSENRAPASNNLTFKPPMQIEPDRITKEVLEMVEKMFPNNIGNLQPFWFAVTRKEALLALEHFIDILYRTSEPIRMRWSRTNHFSSIRFYRNTSIMVC